MTLSTNGSLSVGSASETENSHDKKSQGGLSVSTAYSNTAGDDTLLYSPPTSVLRRRIRYDQIMHIDGVEGDISELNDSESRFLRLESGQSDAADSAYTSGQVSRIRDFVVDDIYPGLNAATFPSTNTPLEAWYTEYCIDIGCIE